MPLYASVSQGERMIACLLIFSLTALNTYQNNGIKMCFIFKETIQCKPFFLISTCALSVILTFTSKSTNSHKYHKLQQPIRACKNGYWLLLKLQYKMLLECLDCSPFINFDRNVENLLQLLPKKILRIGIGKTRGNA